MDMLFGADECRVRTNDAPANFAILDRIVHKLVRKAPGTGSLRLRRKTGSRDDEFLPTLLAA